MTFTRFSLISMLNNLISNCTELDNHIITDALNNNILETKIFFLEKKNSFLRSETHNKQDTIQNLLKNNTTLAESKRKQRFKFKQKDRNIGNNSIIRPKNEGSPRKGK